MSDYLDSKFTPGSARSERPSPLIETWYPAAQVAARDREIAEWDRQHYASEPPDDTADQDERGRTWQPVDLGPILRGERVKPRPSVGLSRSDGLRLLYPGKEHAVIGETESGKSWITTACAAVELLAGHVVVYCHFEEADPDGTVERLQLLDVPDDVILAKFKFVGPEEPLNPMWLAEFGLLEPAPSLAIIDGVNEAMALHDWDADKSHGAAAFRRRLVKPFTAVGTAVLSADHVVKDRERRGRFAMGSVHKGNGLSGALVMVENVEPFGRGQRGRSHVFVTKDRPGALRKHGHAGKTPSKTFMGELVVDDSNECWFEVVFCAPAGDSNSAAITEESQNPDDDAVYAVVADVLAADATANTRAVRARSGMSKDRTADALTRLVLAGRLTETTGPRGARLYGLADGTPTGPPVRSYRTGDQWDQSATGPGTTEDQSGPVGTSEVDGDD